MTHRAIQHTLLILLAIFLAGGVAPDVRAANELTKGLEQADIGRLDRAIELWTRAIQRNPKSYAAHVNRGRAYMMTGSVFKAILDWHTARQLSPAFAYGVYVGPFIREASGDTAMLNFAAPLELDPDHVTSVIMTGALLLDLGYTENTVELFRKSIDLTRNPLLKNHLEHWISTVEAEKGK